MTQRRWAPGWSGAGGTRGGLFQAKGAGVRSSRVGGEMDGKPQCGVEGMEAFSAGLVFGSLCPAGGLPGCWLGERKQELTAICH